MMILTGCQKTLIQTKIINNDTFCEGKYKPLYFTTDQYTRISKARTSDFGDILDIYIKNHALNGKEYKQCKNSS